MSDPLADFRRAVLAALEPVLLPVVKWVARRSYWQQIALLWGVCFAGWMFVQWSITHP
jgi:hypothetical protein